MQKESGVIHVIAEKIADWSGLLIDLSEHGRSIKPEARADEARSNTRDPRLGKAIAVMPQGRNFH